MLNSESLSIGSMLQGVGKSGQGTAACAIAKYVDFCVTAVIFCPLCLLCCAGMQVGTPEDAVRHMFDLSKNPGL